MGSRKHRPTHQLEYLHRKQAGLCHICGQPAELGGDTGDASSMGAVRFRLGSSFGEKGRTRPRVMAHRACAQRRSDEIQLSRPVEESWARSRRFPEETYGLKK